MTALITPDGKPTEAGRAMIEMWRMGVNEWERLQGHRPALPKEKSNGGVKRPITVRQMITGAIKSGPRTCQEIAKMIDKNEKHVAAELSDLRRMSAVLRDVRKENGFRAILWSLP